jgi:hypothetical protein
MDASRGSACADVEVVSNHERGDVPMQITTVGLDIAKNVFQVHGIDTLGPGWATTSLDRAVDAPVISGSRLVSVARTVSQGRAWRMKLPSERLFLNRIR